MMLLNEAVIRHLATYNQFWMELDHLYGNYAKHCGLSDCPFWIFYTLYEGKESYTQKDLSEKLSLSRQTVNSALKSLVFERLIELVPLPGQRKNKQVVLTAEGNNFVEKWIVPMIEAEQNAFEQLSSMEQETLLCLTEKHIRFLQAETNRILNVSSED